ncbi:MAG: hypothetical protein M3N08_06310, partial [Pseudomonadota bacterium]|nr:hypothetical protein [Pseudomonadota bacterium]
FPPEMRRNPAGGAGGAIDHPLNGTLAGGSFHIEGGACPGGATISCFRMRLEGLTNAPCIGLLMAVPVNDADLGIVRVGVGDMALSTTTLSPGLPAATAETWCQVGANNEVDWDFKLRN